VSGPLANGKRRADLESEVVELARRARLASRRTAELSSRVKDAWLARAAERLEAARERLLAANAEDLREAAAQGLAAPLQQRLSLAGERFEAMRRGLLEVAALPDPVGEISDLRVRPNGLRVGRMRIPLGVVAIIYESRPNVTVDAAALCVKAGNAVILRGGSEAFRTNQALVGELRAAARESGLPEDAVAALPSPDRDAIDVLVRQDRCLDLVIPRGGPALIRRVTEAATVPVLKHDAGVCHVFLDASADSEMARAIVRDSKIRQMEVCNALETLLCHERAARSVLPVVLKALFEEGVEIRGCPLTREVFPEAAAASEEDWRTEYLDRILAVRVVADLDAAIEHIRTFGTDHTEVIVTRDYRSAQEFLRRVGSSCVGVNCSTAFADGQRRRRGAEIGIYTSKLHAYGPMGLEGLTTRKFVIYGDGQLRE
jgi:glutamate-5-semialdehyde dehydrogenase